MKNFCRIIVLLAVLAGLTACGNTSQTGQKDTNSGETSETDTNSAEASETDANDDETREKDANSGEAGKEEAETMNRNEQSKENTNILVAYFSCTGTTKPLAEYAAEYLNADLYEIVAEIPYSSEDLDYNTSGCRANKEQDDSSARPAISGKVEDMDRYSTVVLAYPIWWGQAPRIISTFLESYDFNGKTIVPFCTSHSSGIGSSDKNLHSLVDGSVEWKAGKRFAAGTSENEITEWLAEMGIQPFVEENGGKETAERVFDFEKKTVTLNSGYEMPLNGLGTYSLEDETCVSAVSEALKRGVRLIDTAYMYHNDVICCEL